jgi:hypothetical protein
MALVLSKPIPLTFPVPFNGGDEVVVLEMGKLLLGFPEIF